MKGKVNEKLKEKLQRSLVGESLSPINFEEIREKVMYEWFTIEEVKLLGAFKVIIIFSSKQDMEEALESHYLLNHFSEVRK